MLSVLDIILISLGGIAVVLYAFFKIRETIKYNKEYKACIDSGMTPIQAKEYCDKFFSRKKKDKEQETDKIYEE